MRFFGTSDRNVYDRSIMHAFARDGSVELITGFGAYPHLGVVDAYAVVRRGDAQHAVRASDALGGDRMAQEVGPLRFEVVEPLRAIRAVCDGDDLGLSFDLTWRGAFPACDEPRHVFRQDGRLILDASRFVQLGSWEGTVRHGGDELAVDDAAWSGTRDRSWGIRPIGEAEPPGRPGSDDFGFWWCWVPLRFDDFAVVVIVQEEGDGHRVLNDAVRIWPESSGRRPEQLGWPELDIRYRSGTRYPEGATIHLTDRDRRPIEIDIETLGGLALNVGAGYPGDPDWGHGRWMGESWVDARTYSLTDPEVEARLPWGTIDHVARATCDGAVGTGIFEHATMGRHTPSGFTDLMSVAP